MKPAKYNGVNIAASTCNGPADVLESCKYSLYAREITKPHAPQPPTVYASVSAARRFSLQSAGDDGRPSHPTHRTVLRTHSHSPLQRCPYVFRRDTDSTNGRHIIPLTTHHTRLPRPIPRPVETEMAIQMTPPRPPAELPLAQMTHLDVFVHHTAPGSEETYRLAALGQRMLRAAYRAALARMRPDLRQGEQFDAYADRTYPGFVVRWVAVFRWRERMRVPAGQAHMVNLESWEETLRLFETYAGGVVKDYGAETLMNWVEGLVRTP